MSVFHAAKAIHHLSNELSFETNFEVSNLDSVNSEYKSSLVIFSSFVFLY